MGTTGIPHEMICSIADFLQMAEMKEEKRKQGRWW